MGGDISARLYNKTLELEKSGKDYLKEIWRDQGWEPGQSVWRLEFQLKRNTLRQLNICTFPELMSHLSAIWAYASSDWLRLTLPDPSDKTQSRWPLHPLWMALQQANWETELPCERRKTSTGSPPSDKSLFVNGISGLTSYMAREGITDAYEGASAYFRAAKDFHSSREHYVGLSFEEYIDEKVRLKARRYSSIHNQLPGGRIHPADAALAREYRRRSDGE